MYKACIFDLDGTLLDTLTAISYTGNLTFQEFGMEPFEKEEYKYFVGDGAGNLVARAMKKRGIPEEQYEEILDRYQENFAKHCMYQVHPYEGIPELLSSLKEAGVKIAVLSNKPHERTIENIETMFGKGYFDHIQGEQKEVRRKPDPSGVFQIMNRFGLSREDCLYIGDTNTDMQTGKNAGLSTVGVTWGFRPEEELQAFHPAHIAHHPSEIWDVVKKANQIENL
jgi:phosphoglycolate phosphatase